MPPLTQAEIERGLLEMIWSDPRNCEPKLIYADALLERGEEVGEWIRLNCLAPKDRRPGSEAFERLEALAATQRYQAVLHHNEFTTDCGFISEVRGDLHGQTPARVSERVLEEITQIAGLRDRILSGQLGAESALDSAVWRIVLGHKWDAQGTSGMFNRLRLPISTRHLAVDLPLETGPVPGRSISGEVSNANFQQARALLRAAPVNLEVLNLRGEFLLRPIHGSSFPHPRDSIDGIDLLAEILAGRHLKTLRILNKANSFGSGAREAATKLATLRQFADESWIFDQTSLEREKVEHVFGLTGGELEDSPWEFFGDDDRHPRTFSYWYEGLPEDENQDENREYRTLISVGQFYPPKEIREEINGPVIWKQVASRYPTSGETECPLKGVEKLVADDFDCPYCEARYGSRHGVIFINASPLGEVVYQRVEQNES